MEAPRPLIEPGMASSVPRRRIMIVQSTENSIQIYSHPYKSAASERKSISWSQMITLNCPATELSHLLPVSLLASIILAARIQKVGGWRLGRIKECCDMAERMMSFRMRPLPSPAAVAMFLLAVAVGEVNLYAQ